MHFIVPPLALSAHSLLFLCILTDSILAHISPLLHRGSPPTLRSDALHRGFPPTPRSDVL
jgi:hypothetical protein